MTRPGCSPAAATYRASLPSAIAIPITSPAVVTLVQDGQRYNRHCGSSLKNYGSASLPQHREVGGVAEPVDHAVAGHAERPGPAALIDRRLHRLTPDQRRRQAGVERVARPGRVDGPDRISVEVPDPR